MAKWYRMPPTFRISEREYKANIDGMNIVFGAVLGFVLAGAEGLPVMDFALVLFVSATAAISILYLGSSEYRLFYFVSAALIIGAFPLFLDGAVDLSSMPYLQPTLAVWALMVVIVELIPRERKRGTEDYPEENT